MDYFLIGLMVAVVFAERIGEEGKKIGIFNFIFTLLCWPMLLCEMLMEIHDMLEEQKKMEAQR